MVFVFRYQAAVIGGLGRVVDSVAIQRRQTGAKR